MQHRIDDFEIEGTTGQICGVGVFDVTVESFGGFRWEVTEVELLRVEVDGLAVVDRDGAERIMGKDGLQSAEEEIASDLQDAAAHGELSQVAA